MHDTNMVKDLNFLIDIVSEIQSNTKHPVHYRQQRNHRCPLISLELMLIQF